jgi:hypothetical protein
VYDTEEWDPLEGLDLDPEPFEVALDLMEIKNLALSTISVMEDYGLEVRPYPSTAVEGEEVGDDRVDFSLNPLRLATGLVAQERISGMVTSKRDTNLSACLWNFCEVTSQVPCSVDESFHKARKSGNFQNLGFTDVPPIRIVLDCMKGDRSHSSTVPGKATMLASRMRTPRNEFLRDWYLASYLQDGCLRTSRSTEPKYLPQIMGGSGARALWGEPENLYLSVHAYRGGSCQRIYGSASQELRNCVDSLERGNASVPVLCLRLRDKQEYLHGTYADKILIPSRLSMDEVRGTLPTPLLAASGGMNRYSAYENRLIRTRHLVTRTDAEREWSATQRIRTQLLQRENPIPATDAWGRFSKKRARAEFDGALCANTAFSNLLNRKATMEDVFKLIGDGFTPVSSGVTHFSRWDSEWLFFGGRSENYSIEDLTTSEDLFVRREVSEEESLRVGGLNLMPIIGRSQRRVTTRSTIGLYQINEDMYEWSSDLMNRLIAIRTEGKPLSADSAHQEYIRNPEWVNDDSTLIARCLGETWSSTAVGTYVILVSADRRLANQMAETCNVRVIRIHPRQYILWCRECDHDPVRYEPTVAELGPLLDRWGPSAVLRQCYIDTGSIAAWASKFEDGQETGLSRVVERKLVTSHQSRVTGKRTVRYDLLKTTVPKIFTWEEHRPKLRPKKYRHKSGILSETASQVWDRRSSSAAGWRSGSSGIG